MGTEACELDTQVWRMLPQELLAAVMKKFPFASLVAFRAVSKTWCTYIISHVAPHVQPSSGPLLMYFDVFQTSSEDDGFPLWMQFCNFQNFKLTPCSFQKYHQSSSMFLKRFGREDVRLLHCDQGLLFFGLIRRRDDSLRDIVVCNPLTGQSKSLALPQRLGPVCCNVSNLLVGVAFGSIHGSSYDLVVVGRDGVCVAMATHTGTQVAFRECWEDDHIFLSIHFSKAHGDSFLKEPLCVMTTTEVSVRLHPVRERFSCGTCTSLLDIRPLKVKPMDNLQS